MFWNVRHIDILHIAFWHLANQEVVEAACTALAVEEEMKNSSTSTIA